MPSDRELVSTRFLPVSRERVFRACTEPDQLRAWWGPAGFTNTFHAFDPRPGGRWKYDMHGPDGTTYPNESEFAEIAPPERLVLIHLRPMHRFELAMTFAEQNGGTLLTWRMTFETAEEVERVRQFIVPANEQNFDRLEGVLASCS